MRRALLCAILVGLFAPQVIGVPALAIEGRDSQPSMVLQKELDAAIAKMKENGLYEEAGGDKLAIATLFWESRGALDAVHKGGLAFCGYQIWHENISGTPGHKGYAEQEGMTPQAFTQKLVTDPAFCTKYGKKILAEMIDKYGYEKGLCGYSGDLPTYNRTGTCKRVAQMELIFKLLDGDAIFEVERDLNSPDYGNVVAKDKSGNVIFSFLNCQDHSKQMAGALGKAAKAYLNSIYSSGDETFTESVAFDAAHPVHNIRGDTTKTYCFDKLFLYFNSIQRMFDGVEWIEAILIGLANDLLGEVCGYAIQMLATAANNLLAQMCMPLPDLSLGLAVPGVDRKSCEGQSMSNVLSVAYGHASWDDLFGGGYNRTEEEGFPPVNSILTDRPDTMPPYGYLRLY